MYYKESKSDGQMLEEGITEAGVHGVVHRWQRPPHTRICTASTMIPFYIYYSMFGFQRVGDLAWLAA